MDRRKLPIMRALARFHACDAETLYNRIDASEIEVQDVLSDMLSKNEVEASQRHHSGGRDSDQFNLTLKGWDEYLRALGSIYELSE